MVARRLIPLVVAFALAFAPVALEVCQVSCQSHALETLAAGPAPHHHSHEAAQGPAMPVGHVHHHTSTTEAPQSHVVMLAKPHPCDHGDDLPTFSSQSQNTLITPAVTAWAFRLPEPEIRGVRVRALDARAVSTRITLKIELRV